MHAKMASHKRKTYEIEPRTYVLFIFELDDVNKSVKSSIVSHMFACLGWKLSVWLHQ